MAAEIAAAGIEAGFAADTAAVGTVADFLVDIADCNSAAAAVARKGSPSRLQQVEVLADSRRSEWAAERFVSAQQLGFPPERADVAAAAPQQVSERRNTYRILNQPMLADVRYCIPALTAFRRS